MIIILHGKDNFRSRQKLKELESAYMQKHKSGFSFEKLYSSGIDFKQLKNALQSGSLFDSFKLIVLEDLMQNSQLKKQIVNWSELKNIKNDKNTIFILFESTVASKDSDYKKIITLVNKKQEFKELSINEAVKYFSVRFNKLSVEIIREVIQLCGTDMWKIYNELNKVYAYSAGRKTTKDILKILSIGKEDAQIFPTIDAIFEGKADKAFYNILLHWQAGEAPEYIFYMIERQLRIIAQVKEAARGGTVLPRTAKTLGLHPYVVKKTLKLINKFSESKIKALYTRVESLDLKTKTGQLNPYLSCELLSAAVLSD